MIDWNDIRYFVEVASTGSTATAARRLGVSHPTVARRIAALEEATGAQLFERRAEGYRLTEFGAALLPAGETVAGAAARFQDAAKAESRHVRGSIRLTTSEFVAEQLAPAMREFRKLYPAVAVELIVTNRYLDIDAGEAEIAIRAGPRPQHGKLVARLLATESFTVYCSPDYADERGKPASLAELSGHDVVIASDELAVVPIVQWFVQGSAAAGARVACASSSIPNLASNLRAGVGVGVLGQTSARVCGGLVRCFDAPREFDVPTWIITHERLRNVPRVRALIDFIVSYHEQWVLRLPDNP